jgi:hypothetical protein
VNHRRASAKRSNLALAALALAAATVIGCSSEPVDPAYLGAWSRSPTSASIFALSQEDSGKYGFSWSVETGSKTVRCETPGHCVEYQNGEKRFDWRFRVFRRRGQAGVFVEARATPLSGGAGGVHWVDHLVLQPSGELWAHKIEQAGRRLDDPIGPLKYVRRADVALPLSGTDP